ncbi:MAG: bifunctional oligoribonuclease/PAP phosphatase NrnA [Actinobacteria bacterium]|nr:bifunctional oligoribonuclease/PAP phosphatase NrnA [Actinomycetota bacterium]
MATVNPVEQALQAVAEALKAEARVLITCHVNPDGDAAGSMIALHRALTQLGVDSIMYLASTEPVAVEWRFLAGLAEVIRGGLPDDYQFRTLVAVDCGNAERIGNDDLVRAAPRIINIDHHADNTRFGEINLVVGGASSTAEILFFLLQRMEVNVSPEIAEALYTGILVDSGRFQYASASPSTFRVAADLISRGVDHTAIFRYVYETVPLSKVKLSCRMFDRLTIACGGRLAAAVLEMSDFNETGADGSATEGLVDSLRAIDGVLVAALIYAQSGNQGGGAPLYRISLRSSTERISVQRIAKAKGGGGHVQAAGASITGETPAQIISFLTERVDAALKRAGIKAAGCDRAATGETARGESPDQKL